MVLVLNNIGTISPNIVMKHIIVKPFIIKESIYTNILGPMIKIFDFYHEVGYILYSR